MVKARFDDHVAADLVTWSFEVAACCTRLRRGIDRPIRTGHALLCVRGAHVAGSAVEALRTAGCHSAEMPLEAPTDAPIPTSIVPLVPVQGGAGQGAGRLEGKK